MKIQSSEALYRCTKDKSPCRGGSSGIEIKYFIRLAFGGAYSRDVSSQESSSPWLVSQVALARETLEHLTNENALTDLCRCHPSVLSPSNSHQENPQLNAGILRKEWTDKAIKTLDFQNELKMGSTWNYLSGRTMRPCCYRHLLLWEVRHGILQYTTKAVECHQQCLCKPNSSCCTRPVIINHLASNQWGIELEGDLEGEQCMWCCKLPLSCVIWHWATRSSLRAGWCKHAAQSRSQVKGTEKDPDKVWSTGWFPWLCSPQIALS